MQVVAGDNMFLLEGTASGNGYNGTVGLMILPVVDASQIMSNDLQNGPSENDTFLLKQDWAAPSLLAALKALFDNQTYGDGTTSTTVTDPKITEIAQTSTDVTPS